MASTALDSVSGNPRSRTESHGSIVSDVSRANALSCLNDGLGRMSESGAFVRIPHRQRVYRFAYLPHDLQGC